MTDSILILLPPSETKSEGGSRSFSGTLRPIGDPEADAVRARTIEDLVRLSSGDPAVAARALKLPATKAEAELARNRALPDAPLKPAIERYTGVLYDAVDAAGRSAAERSWLDAHVRIHSALYGLVRADDPIAAYRLSHDSRLPGETLKARWSRVLARVLAAHDGPVLDLRSKGYVALGPLEPGPQRAWGDVREEQADGSFRSLNHFNKRTKGLIVRRLAESGAAGMRFRRLEDLAPALDGLVRLDRLDDGALGLTVRSA